MAFVLGGLLLCMVGAGAFSLSCWGWFQAESMASIKSEGFDAEQWRATWRLWSAFAMFVSALLVAAGIALLRRKLQGLIWVAIAGACVGLFPWAKLVLGRIYYAFETPSIWETAAAFIVGLSALSAYFLLRARVNRSQG